MKLKDFNLFSNLWVALKEFFKDGGLDKSSSLAYYSILSSIFLLTFFIFLFTRILGSPDIVLKSIFPFSPDFFSKISPDIFKRAEEISARMKDIGIIGILLFFFLGFLIFKKVVQFVNEMFYIKIQKGFMTRRVSEFGLLFIIGLLVLVSFFLTGFISTMTTLFYKNEFIASHINPLYIQALNTFLLKYLAPFAVTCSFFFILYKWIPEVKVYVKSALISAIFCALLWEVVKRLYAYFLVNVSVIGQIKGPLIAIVLFGFWMELSLGIMLYGAKLTYILNNEKNAKFTEAM
jgi:membrane protein